MPTVVFRGDTRSPEEIIAEGGFKEEGQPVSYGWISTSLSAKEAKNFALRPNFGEQSDHAGGWLYTIVTDVSNGAIVGSLPTQRPLVEVDPYEVKARREIPLENILAARQVDAEGRLIGAPVYFQTYTGPRQIRPNLPMNHPKSKKDGAPELIENRTHASDPSTWHEAGRLPDLPRRAPIPRNCTG